MEKEELPVTKQESIKSKKEQKPKSKLKILCLHGLLQSSNILNRKLLEILTFFKPHYDLETVIPDAPILIDIDKETNQESRGWFQWDEKKENYLGFDETIAEINQISINHPDINLLIGFSQGGTVTVLTCMLKSLNVDYKELFPNLKGVILISTGIRSWPISNKITNMINLYLENNKLIEIPSLHVYGEEDDIVIPEKSILTSKIFDKSIIYKHEGKHFIPKRSIDKKEYLKFIKTII